MKLLKLGTIALDGTKLKANASKHKALSYGHAKKLEAQFRAEVKALTQRAESADREDAADGMDIPAEIARREARLAAIAEAKAKIEARAEERDAVEQAAYQEKVARREAQRKAGKTPRGRDPEPPTGAPPPRQGSGQPHRPAVTHHAGHRQGLRSVLQRPSRGRYRQPVGDPCPRHPGDQRQAAGDAATDDPGDVTRTAGKA